MATDNKGLVYTAQQTSVVPGYTIRRIIKMLGYNQWSEGGTYAIRCSLADEAALIEILREHNIPCGRNIMQLAYE